MTARPERSTTLRTILAVCTIALVRGKPSTIGQSVGKRPLLVGGNVLSGGDIAMMRYSKDRNGPSLQLLINHDDTAREFAYTEPDNFSLGSAEKYGFHVVSIKDDWATIFAP